MNIEFLYFDDCPSWHTALENLQKALAGMGITASIETTAVETDEQAQISRFTGSPMIRVDGSDLFPIGDAAYALACRVYQTPEGPLGWPTEDMISQMLESLLEAGPGN